MKISSTLSLKNVKRSRIYQYLGAITGTLGIAASEMHYGWPSPSIPILTSGNYTITISSLEGSWLTVMTLIGAVLGAIVTAAVIDIVGRKGLILFSCFPFIFSWILIGLAPSSVYLHVARFIAGLTDGLSFTAVPMYLGEIAEPEIRGFLSSMCPVSIVVGLLLTNILGNYLSLSTAAFISCVAPLALFVTFIWIPESPYFLLMRGRTAEARRSLEIFRGTAEVDAEIERLADAVRKQNQGNGRFWDLVTVASNRKAVFITLGLRTVQQLCGTTAITFYCKTIFEESKDFISPSVGTILYFSVQLVLSGVFSYVVDFSGRRPLLIISIIGTAFTLLLNGIYLYIKNCTEIDVSSVNFIPLVALLGFVIIFSVGLQTIPLLIMSEMFPTNVKACALCLADVYFNIIALVISKFFHGANDAFGMHVPFFTFTVCCVFGLAFIFFFVPETKGRTLEDIQRYLKGEIKL